MKTDVTAERILRFANFLEFSILNLGINNSLHKTANINSVSITNLYP